uniref:NodB homology domain-containing protein n=1 Tax=Globisporangium ultimum (strain ATCC 200006 / CBS 805.95 / DAOM BR144) TaxID=431595 RepID=K3WB45_GLOUD
MAVITSVLQIAAATLALALLLLLLLAYVQPRWFMRFLAWASHPSVLWCVNTSERVCSLTIDDAPSASTPLILDILKQHNVKATFFIISDRITGNEDVVRRIVREGHTLGNHLTEDRASVLDALHVFEQKLKECDRAIRVYQPDASVPVVPLAAVAAVADEVRKAEAETTKLLNGSNGAPNSSSVTLVRWLRPASGWFTSSMREVIQTNGYRICLGSVYPHDAQIKFEFLNALHLRTFTGNGSVIIVHDRKWTVGVLQAALPALTKKLRFVSLNELIQHE